MKMSSLAIHFIQLKENGASESLSHLTGHSHGHIHRNLLLECCKIPTIGTVNLCHQCFKEVGVK